MIALNPNGMKDFVHKFNRINSYQSITQWTNQPHELFAGPQMSSGPAPFMDGPNRGITRYATISSVGLHGLTLRVPTGR